MSETMDEVAALREEVAELRERVVELESDDGDTAEVGGRFDARDADVIDALIGNEGQTFHVRQLVSIYRDQTDIRRKKTLKRRVKDLVKSDVFESEAGARHTFVGHDGGNNDE